MTWHPIFRPPVLEMLTGFGAYRNLEDYYYVETSAKTQLKPFYVACCKGDEISGFCATGGCV